MELNHQPFLLLLDNLLQHAPDFGIGQVSELEAYFQSVLRVVKQFRSYKSLSDQDERFRVVSFRHLEHWVRSLQVWGSSSPSALADMKNAAELVLSETVADSKTDDADPLALAECEMVLGFLHELFELESQHWQPGVCTALWHEVAKALEWTCEEVYKLKQEQQVGSMFRLWNSLRVLTAGLCLDVVPRLAEALESIIDADDTQFAVLERYSLSLDTGPGRDSEAKSSVAEEVKLALHSLDAELQDDFESKLVLLEPGFLEPVPSARSRNGATKTITQSRQRVGTSESFFATITLTAPGVESLAKLKAEVRWLQHFRQRRSESFDPFMGKFTL